MALRFGRSKSAPDAAPDASISSPEPTAPIAEDSHIELPPVDDFSAATVEPTSPAPDFTAPPVDDFSTTTVEPISPAVDSTLPASDDWSSFSTETQTDTTAPEEDWSTFSTSGDTVVTTQTSDFNTAPVTATPDFGTMPTPVDVQPIVDVPPPAPPRKKLPVLPLALAALGLIALTAGAYFLMGTKEPEEETVAPPMAVLPPRPTPAPTAGKRVVKKPVVTSVVATPRPGAKVARRVTVGPTPVAPVRVAKAGRPGAAGVGSVDAPDGTAPSIKPARPGITARIVPVRGVPTPIQPPSNQAGEAGKFGNRNEVLVVRRTAPSSALTPALQAQLDRLWQQGADAKHRQPPDIAGARRAWQQMLRLRPGHPGVQSAIDKLPRS